MNRDSVLVMIEKLDTEDQLLLLENLATIVRDKMSMKKHSILELGGLGKKIWKGIDAQGYVSEERESWDG